MPERGIGSRPEGPSEPRTLPLAQSPHWRYWVFVLLVCGASVAVKVTLAPYAPYSQCLSDDYNYMYKSICYVHGDWTLESFRFRKTHTPPGYPLLISPWLLFDAPRARFLFIYCLQFAMSALLVYLGTKIVTRLSGVRSILVPICLATYAPAFLFNFYVMSESVFFLLLVVLAWLMMDFEQTCRRRGRLACLFLVVILAPLLRMPGYAILPAILLLLLLHRKELGWRRVVVLGIAIPLAAMIPQQSFYHLMTDAGRVGFYVSSISKSFTKAQDLSYLAPFKFLSLSFANQIGYVFVSTGYWPLPAIAVLLRQMRKWPRDPRKKQWRNILVFALITACILLCFAELHLATRFRLQMRQATFLLGRYDDPAGILVLVTGLAAILSMRPFAERFRMVVFGLIAPSALALMLYRLDDRIWHPMHDIGLAVFALQKLKHFPLYYPSIAVGSVLLIGLLIRYRRVSLPALLTTMVVFNVLCLKDGFAYTSRWSLGIAKTLEAAEWTVENLPENTHIACDEAVKRVTPAPGLEGWPLRDVFNVERAYVVCVYPRPVVYTHMPVAIGDEMPKRLMESQYLFTLPDYHTSCDLGFPVVWENDHYVIYKVEPSPRRMQWTLHLSDFEVSRDGMVGPGRRSPLLMAWHGCWARVEDCRLEAGRYKLVVRARGDGCSDPASELIVQLPDIAERRFAVMPGRTEICEVPFELTNARSVGIRLTNMEKPGCLDGADKNIYLESAKIVRVGSTELLSSPPAGRSDVQP